MDDDLADVLGGLQPDVFPARTAVMADVDAVAVADVPAADVFPGAHPERVRVGRIQRQVSDRVRALAVEDRRPGRARVDGLPDPAGTHADVPDVVVFRMDHDIGDPPGHERRADGAQFQALERGLQRIAAIVLVVLAVLRQGRGQKGGQDEQCEQFRGREGERLESVNHLVSPKSFWS